MLTVLIVSIVVCCLLSGFFSAAQTALLSLSTMQIKGFKQDKDPRKKLVAKLVAKPRELLVTLFMLDILVNLLVQNFSSSLFGSKASWALKVGVPLLLTLTIGEILPKSLAFAYKTQVAYRVAPFVDWIAKIFGPLRSLLTTITSFVSSFIFFFLKKENTISKEELQEVLSASKKQGILSIEEARIIDGYLDLADKAVKEILRPRQEVILYNIDEPLSKLIDLFVEEACSKIPVCQGGIENIKGIISAREFFLHKQDIKTSKDLLKFVKAPYFVPESTKAKMLLGHFFKQNQSIAIVVSEYGNISGIITEEDLVEEVIGDISDKRDSKALYTKAAKDIIIASGKMEISDFEDLFGIDLKSETNQVTLGGWMTEKLGDIPKEGAFINYEGFLFKVLASEPTRVKRIYIRRKN
jgi:putative hemolysin